MRGTYAQESKVDEERTGFLMSDCEPPVRQFGQDPSSAVTSNQLCSEACSADHALDLLQRNPSWVATADALMAALGAKDDETSGHAERVVSFSQRLGRKVGLSRLEIAALELGARLHDIGKIAVPDSILHKPAELDPEEWQKMRQHPARGAAMVRKLRLPASAALRGTSQNHRCVRNTVRPTGRCRFHANPSR